MKELWFVDMFMYESHVSFIFLYSNMIFYQNFMHFFNVFSCYVKGIDVNIENARIS